MSLKLYFDFMSQPSRALFILMHKSNILFEECPIAISKGEHLTDEFKNVSRIQKLPVLDHNGFKLTESIAIVRYLAREQFLPDNWYPKNSKLQARVDEYFEWQHANTRALCFLYFQKKWLMPILTGEEASPKTIASYEKRMSDCLDCIEKLWLSSGNYICGDVISAADIWAACEIEQARIAGYDPSKGRPKLAAWFLRVGKDTSPYYQEAHKLSNEAASGNLKLFID